MTFKVKCSALASLPKQPSQTPNKSSSPSTIKDTGKAVEVTTLRSSINVKSEIVKDATEVFKPNYDVPSEEENIPTPRQNEESDNKIPTQEIE